MIRINGIAVSVGKFPDGTQNIQFGKDILSSISLIGTERIEWFYDSEDELFVLISSVDFIRRNFGPDKKISLYMPYVPNSRMDRVKEPSDNFSLKVFSGIINSLGFSFVYVNSVHSNVSEALIDRIVSCMDEDVIRDAIHCYKPDVIFFPDEGSCKRYSGLHVISESGIPVSFGIKKREWSTGKITGLDVVSDTDLNGKRVLIVDDICSYGGTFRFSAIKLREMGASDVGLYVTHCEDSIRNGELLKTDLISVVYTTDSILHIEDEKIRVIRKFRK